MAGETAPPVVDSEEAAHWRDVLLAVRTIGATVHVFGATPHLSPPPPQFRDYAAWMGLEERRRAVHEAALSPRHRALLADGALERKAAALRGAVAANQALLSGIAREQEEGGFGPQMLEAGGGAADSKEGDSDASGAGDGRPRLPTSSAAHFSKVRSTLHQLSRDWSVEGRGERDHSYAPVLAQLRAWLPVTAANVNHQKVCCPGSGLGRLVWECARLGYAAQGCEFSFFMLFASHFVLNATEGAGVHTMHPWIHDPSNHMRWEDMTRAVTFPDVNPTSLADVNPAADFSMAAGDFVDIYRAPSQVRRGGKAGSSVRVQPHPPPLPSPPLHAAGHVGCGGDGVLPGHGARRV